MLSEILNNKFNLALLLFLIEIFGILCQTKKKYKEELKEISERMGMQFIDGEIVIDKNNLKHYVPEDPHL